MLASTFSCVMLFMLLPLSLASSSGASCAVSFTMLSYTDEPSRRSRKSAEPDIYVIKYQFFLSQNTNTHTLTQSHHTHTNTHTNKHTYKLCTMALDNNVPRRHGSRRCHDHRKHQICCKNLPLALRTQAHTHTYTHDNPKISHCQTPPPPPAPPAPRRLTHAYTTLNLN